MPGSSTSMANCAVPFTLKGMSLRGWLLPMSRNSDGFLRSSRVTCGKLDGISIEPAISP